MCLASWAAVLPATEVARRSNHSKNRHPSPVARMYLERCGLEQVGPKYEVHYDPKGLHYIIAGTGDRDKNKKLVLLQIRTFKTRQGPRLCSAETRKRSKAKTGTVQPPQAHKV